jgi:hypothetical protein
MDAFLSFVQALPDVQVVVASQAPLLYLDRAKGRSFTPGQVAQLCAPMPDGVIHQQCDGAWLSPAEIYGLVVSLLAARVRDGQWPAQVPYRYFDGPPEPPVVQLGASALPLDDVYGTCLFEDAYLNSYGRMPAQIQVGRNWLAPADWLATDGADLPRWLEGSGDDAPLVRGDFASAQYVPDHVSWNWVIFPPGFDGDPLLQLGKLQAWTLKPAPLRS